MGGMQTFQWMVSYPGFMDKAIPIVGSPRLAPYDLMHWQTENDIIMSDPAWHDGEYTENPARVLLGDMSALLLTTPEAYNKNTTRQQVFDSPKTLKNSPGFDANNRIRQSQAMMALDVSDAFGGSLERAAVAVKTQVLVVVATQDHVVTPGPALEFAKLLRAQVLELEGDCGHLAPGCEQQKMGPVIASFLEK
jgi:homoserine O-acetyltransferase